MLPAGFASGLVCAARETPARTQIRISKTNLRIRPSPLWLLITRFAVVATQHLHPPRAGPLLYASMDVCQSVSIFRKQTRSERSAGNQIPLARPAWSELQSPASDDVRTARIWSGDGRF